MHRVYNIYIGFWISGLIDIDMSHWITHVCRPLISTFYSYQFQCFPRAHLIIFNEICYHSHSSPWLTYSFPHETYELQNLWPFLSNVTIILPLLHNKRETFSTALRDMCIHFRENYLWLVSHRGKMCYTYGISLWGCRKHFGNVWLLWLPGKKEHSHGYGADWTRRPSEKQSD